jgi:hypothetical protein
MAKQSHSRKVNFSELFLSGFTIRCKFLSSKVLEFCLDYFPRIEQHPVFLNFDVKIVGRKPMLDFTSPSSKVKTLVLPD